MEKNNIWWYLKRAQIVLTILVALKALLPAGPCPDFMLADAPPMHIRIAGQVQVNASFPTATQATVNAVN